MTNMNKIIKRTKPKAIVAGIGSRRLPRDESELLFKAVFISVLTEGFGYASGGAPGADTTTEHAVKAALRLMSDSKSEFDQLTNEFLSVYLPGKFFNGRSSRDPGMVDATLLAKHEEAKDLANETHPAGFKKGDDPKKKRMLKPFVLNLHARNGHQCLGKDLNSPVRSVLCFTPDGAKGSQITSKTGGTGQALRLAHKFGIPVINTGNDLDRKRISSWIEKKSEVLKSKFNIDVHRAYHDYAVGYSAGLNDYVGDVKTKANELGLEMIIEEAPSSSSTANHGSYEITSDSSGSNEKLVVKLSFNLINRKGDFDYKPLEGILKRLNEEYPGKTIGVPRIGVEQGGCWLTISEMIKNKCYRMKPTIITTEKNLEFKPSSTIKGEQSRQATLGF